MKISFISDILDKIRIELDSLNPVPFKVYHIGGKNAGDFFNVPLLKYFKIKYRKTRSSNANLICVGSMLDKGNLIYSANAPKPEYKCSKCIIAGAGFDNEEFSEVRFGKDVIVLALRGKLSKEMLEKITNTKFNCTLADPGILAPIIFPLQRTHKYSAGIIPHFADKNSVPFKNISLKKYIIINIKDNLNTVLEKINQCECIFSSSLHGLIFAESYGIPSRRILLSDKISTYKFKDFYSAFDMELPESIDLRKTILDETLLSEVIKTYVDKSKMIKQKQQDLINIYSDLDKYLQK